MKGRSQPNDGRLRIWLPEKARWVREALSHSATMREMTEGIPSSISAEALRVLERALGGFMGRRAKKQLQIEFREKDEHILEEVKAIVAAKKAMGFKDVSVNFEAVRLMKAGLLALQGRGEV